MCVHATTSSSGTSVLKYARCDVTGQRTKNTHHTHLNTHVHIYTHGHTCTHTCTRTHTHVHTHTYIHTHIHTQVRSVGQRGVVALERLDDHEESSSRSSAETGKDAAGVRV